MNSTADFVSPLSKQSIAAGDLYPDATGGNLYDVTINAGSPLLTTAITIGTVTVANGGWLYVNNGGYLSVTGTLDNTGGHLEIEGEEAGSQITVSGAAPSTLQGGYALHGSFGGSGDVYQSRAILQWGSGGITQIGDGALLFIDGTNAYSEIGATNSNSALSVLTTIASSGALILGDGATANIGNDLTILAGGELAVVGGVTGGSSVTITGNLTNKSGVFVQGGEMSASDLLHLTGTLDNTGGSVEISGGSVAGATSQLTVGGAAPSTLQGTYYLTGGETNGAVLPGGAILQWGSGGITQIGDGASHPALLSIDGANAYAEIGATNSNSALSGLTTIASNGGLLLSDGATANIGNNLTILAGGELGVDPVDPILSFGNKTGGSNVMIAGNLTNNSASGVIVGNNNMNTSDALTVTGTFANAAGALTTLDGGGTGVTATLSVNGPVSNAGSITIGTNGVLTTGSGYQQFSNGTLEELIGGPAIGQFGVIHVSGYAALAGTLKITLDGGYTPTVGDTFTFLTLTAGDLAGTFAHVVATNAPGSWAVNYDNLAGTVSLEYTTTPEPASLGLLTLGGLGLLLRRRERRHF